MAKRFNLPLSVQFLKFDADGKETLEKRFHLLARGAKRAENLLIFSTLT